jgi:hypothetical protein
VALRLIREPDGDPARRRPNTANRRPRSENPSTGSKIDVTLIRAFLRSALGDDAVVDKVNSLICDHVAGSIYHRTVVASSLQGFINEILETATRADWQAVADDLIAEGHDPLNESRLCRSGAIGKRPTAWARGFRRLPARVPVRCPRLNAN